MAETTDTTLDGATTPGEPNAYPANAGEFAARWNAATPEQRDAKAAAIIEAAIGATFCIETDHRGRIAHLEAIAAAPRDDATPHAAARPDAVSFDGIDITLANDAAALAASATVAGYLRFSLRYAIGNTFIRAGWRPSTDRPEHAAIVRALHAIHRPIAIDTVAWECAQHDCAHGFTCPKTRTETCAECYRIAVDDENDPDRVETTVPPEWPCPTAAALGIPKER